MKKSTKPAASPAPATAKPAAPSAPAKKIASVEPKTPAPAAKTAAPAAKTSRPPSAKAPAAPSTPISEAPARSVLERVAPAAGSSLTLIRATIDVGFGNVLFIRGEGPGLSWNKGLPLTNAGPDQWTISLPRAMRPIVFKFLLNDESWSAGEDYQADPGATVTYTPGF